VAEFLFVTGRLAASALHTTLEKLEPEFDYEVAVLAAPVAALMRVEWVARRLSDARGCDTVMLPGLCRGDLSALEAKLGVPVIRGPKDLKDLPLFFGKERSLEGYGEYQTKILAEIVEAYQMSWEEILATAEYYRRCGADMIDLGCPPMEGFPGVADVVAGLKERGFAVSVDTFDSQTIREADEAGVDLESLERNAARVASLNVPLVMDPILEPLGFGFTESLHRYAETRRRHPETEILMGVGNLTELTDADSTGINAVMAGLTTELGVDYVLTTEVISWARGSVMELDLARKLMHYAAENRIPPKSIDDGLIALKDTPFEPYTESELRDMQSLVRDKNLRIFADRTSVYVFDRSLFLSGTDPDELFGRLDVADAGHAFYLGRELERATLAVRLGKRYVQESELRWGYLGDDRRRLGEV
jgi:dihydropteroate synthase